VQLGVHAALGAPDQASFAIVARTNGATWLIPLFTPMLVAVRWALR